MTTKPESNFGREIMKNIDAHLERFETYGKVGVPDIYGIRNSVVIWLELKCIKQNSINLSPFQISWNYNNFRHGGKNYYIVKDTRSKVLNCTTATKV
jgi:Holliday junction resolvase